MKKNLLSALLSLLLLLGLAGPARAATPPPATGRPLAEALNPDGTLKAGLNGSFDARAFRMRTAPDGRPVFRPAGTAGAGDERWADGFNLSNGTEEGLRAVVSSGADIYIGGGFTAVGNVVANYVAKWNGTAWSALGAGNGVNGEVYALAVAGNGDVYAGGAFTQAGGAAANHVARWNGTAWSALGTGAANGVNDNVYSLAVAGSGDVYVGGYFSQAGGAAANHVARWNGTAWSALGTGAGYGNISALAVAGNGDVYVGGFFTQAGGVAANNVARWNGTAWSALGAGAGNGVNNGVYALVVAGNGDVYASGLFNQAGGAAANYVARWNGTAWSALGAGAGNGVNNSVSALAVAGNGDVYIGGAFTQAGGAAANHVARWNGTVWSTLGTGAGNGVRGNLFALAVASNGDVYAGGSFHDAGGAETNNVARWNGTAWTAPGAGAGNGVNGIINAMAVAGNGDVYVGGAFNQAGGVAANSVAKWDGTAWSSLGTGAGNGVNGFVNALAVAANGDVYAGGIFGQAGGVVANRVAKWNGTAWSALGAGTANGVNNFVYALAVTGNGDVYIGGLFTQAGGAAANYVAKWNGTAWSALGTGQGNGVNYYGVYALAVAGNGDVYVGGAFTAAGGVAADYVAKWNGTTWSDLGAGLFFNNSNIDNIRTLVVTGNGDVYAGGRFTQVGGAASSYVAKWNGSTWSALGAGLFNNGPYGSVYGLAVAGNGDVYAGGQFIQAGGSAANDVAKWNGTAWSPLGTGMNNVVYSLAVGPTGKIYAGGAFTAIGDGSKLMSHFGIYDPNAPLATNASAAMPAAQLFPNPAHGTATLRLPAGVPRLLLTLSDALGRTVRRYPAPATAEAELDLRGLPAGAYSVRCGQFSQRLVVE